MEIENLKGEIALNKQTILSLGFVKDDGQTPDEEETPKVVEQLQVATQDLDSRFKMRQMELQNRLKETQENRQYLLKQQELALKQQEINARKEIADKQMKIAKINKN